MAQFITKKYGSESWDFGTTNEIVASMGKLWQVSTTGTLKMCISETIYQVVVTKTVANESVEEARDYAKLYTFRAGFKKIMSLATTK